MLLLLALSVASFRFSLCLFFLLISVARRKALSRPSICSAGFLVQDFIVHFQSRYLLPFAPFISLHSFSMVGLLSELFYIGIPIRHGLRLFLPLYHSDSGWNHVSLQCSIVNSIKTASDSLFCCLFLCLKVCWSCSAKRIYHRYRQLRVY